MSTVNVNDLVALAANTHMDLSQFAGPHPQDLERFASPWSLPDVNKHNAVGFIEISCPEFTSLCPLTKSPDFATIKIKYKPNLWCVESKSLKLYLMSFRNVGEFHESCVARICDDLVALISPRYMIVTGEFTPRGGIPFWPTSVYNEREAAKD